MSEPHNHTVNFGNFSSGKAPPPGNIRDMLAAKGLRRVLATSSLVVTGVDLFQFYMPIYGHDLGLSASVIGFVLAIFSAASFVVRLFIRRLIARLSERKLLAYAFFTGAAGLVLVPFFKSAVVLAVVSFAFGPGMGCGQPITMMMAVSNSAEGRSGEALGLRATANHLTKILIPVMFGSIGPAFGLFPVFRINARMLTSGGAVSLHA